MPNRWLEHLTHADLDVLARLSGAASGDELLRQVRNDPPSLERILAEDAVFAGLFSRVDDPFLVASPFLIFAVLVHRVARDLERAAFVPERPAPRRRVPLFDAGRVREFLDDPMRRLFLAELLASYTRVASGAVWARTERGWHRRRFSDLDPVALVSLLDVVPESERAGVYRRLGDLALFLTGVFPDAALGWLSTPLARERLLRSDPERPRAYADDADTFELLEQLGVRWYRTAWATASAQTDSLAVVRAVAERFEYARRVLNVVADRHLFPFRGRWFPTFGA